MNQQELVLGQLAAVHEGTKKLEGMVSQVTAEGIGASLLDFLTAKINHSEKKIWQRESIIAIYRDWENSIEKRCFWLVDLSRPAKDSPVRFHRSASLSGDGRPGREDCTCV